MARVYVKFATAAMNVIILICRITQVCAIICSTILCCAVAHRRFKEYSGVDKGKHFDLFSFSIHDDGIGVSSVFYFVAALSIVQLLICCAAEYQRLKQPSLLKALRLTTQKLLYFVVFIAALLRGAYFTTPVSAFHSLSLANASRDGVCTSAGALYH